MLGIKKFHCKTKITGGVPCKFKYKKFWRLALVKLPSRSSRVHLGTITANETMGSEILAIRSAWTQSRGNAFGRGVCDYGVLFSIVFENIFIYWQFQWPSNLLTIVPLYWRNNQKNFTASISNLAPNEMVPATVWLNLARISVSGGMPNGAPLCSTIYNHYLNMNSYILTPMCWQALPLGRRLQRVLRGLMAAHTGSKRGDSEYFI